MTIPDLSPSQKFTLLYIRKAGADGLFTKVVETMQAMGIRFTPADMTALREMRYLERVNVKGVWRHRLTPQGSFKATQLVRDLACQYGIHHVTFRKAAPGSNMGPSCSCTCRWGAVASKTNEARLQRDAERHLSAVAAGTYRGAQSFEDFWDAEIRPKLYATPVFERRA